jgi:gluconokinase
VPRRQRLTSLVLMGVAGAGKSSVMAALERRLGWPAMEGDGLHPPANVAKMAAGVALTDADREPWLKAVAAWIGAQEAARRSSLVTCSALRRRYRDVLRRGHPWIWFVHLEAPSSVLRERIGGRSGHFMPASMLDSQLATLEPLEPDEPGSTVEALGTPVQVADRLIQSLRLEPKVR